LSPSQYRQSIRLSCLLDNHNNKVKTLLSVYTF
jgi:hypothetical protein